VMQIETQGLKNKVFKTLGLKMYLTLKKKKTLIFLNYNITHQIDSARMHWQLYLLFFFFLLKDNIRLFAQPNN